MTGAFTTDGAGGFSFSIFAPPPVTPPTPEIFRSQEGIGYPSCSRALAKIPPNVNDANGYYAAIEVEPWADEKTIRRAIRRFLAKYHPDGSAPDLAMFARIKEIAHVLLDPITRRNYNSIPKGRKLIDSEVLKEMDERGIGDDDPGVQKFDRTAEDMADPDKDTPDHKERRRRAKMWDYLAIDANEMDLVNANEWYGYLLEVAPLFQYESVIKVLMHDGASSAFKHQGCIMLIPRAWEPNAGSALLMMYRHVGWPKLTPRHVEHSFPITDRRFTGTGINGGGGLLLPTSSAFPVTVSE